MTHLEILLEKARELDDPLDPKVIGEYVFVRMRGGTFGLFTADGEFAGGTVPGDAITDRKALWSLLPEAAFAWTPTGSSLTVGESVFPFDAEGVLDV